MCIWKWVYENKDSFRRKILATFLIFSFKHTTMYLPLDNYSNRAYKLSVRSDWLFANSIKLFPDNFSSRKTSFSPSHIILSCVHFRIYPS